ncbi:unnamed protein product [Natator depressus]
MTSGAIFLLLGLLALWAQLPPASGGSRGSCPKPLGAGLCAELCASDGSCPEGEKCCSNGCGHQCTRVSGGARGDMPPP